MNFIGTIKGNIKKIYERGGFHIIGGNFINKFVGLCGSIFIVRLLSKSDYGTLSYIENLYSYLYIFCGLGLSASLLRYNVIAENRETAYGYFNFVVKKESLINVCLLLIAGVFCVIYSHPSEYSKATFLLPILFLAIPFQDIANASLCNERAMFANKRYVNFSIMASVVSVLFRVVGSFLGGVTGTVLFRVASDVLVAAILYNCVRNKYFKGYKIDYPSPKKKREISVYAFQNMVANGIWILFMITDVLLIGRLGSGPEMLAEYKVAYLLPSNMAIITGAITVFIGPYFVKNEKNLKWIKTNYIKVILVSAVSVGAFALFLGVFAKWIILLLYGESYLNVVPLMRLLLFAHFINACFKGVTGNLLATMGQAKANMLISFIGFVLQVSMGIYVIPRYGTIGLVTGSICVYTFMSLTLIVVFVKKYKFFDIKK